MNEQGRMRKAFRSFHGEMRCDIPLLIYLVQKCYLLPPQTSFFHFGDGAASTVSLYSLLLLKLDLASDRSCPDIASDYVELHSGKTQNALKFLSTVQTTWPSSPSMYNKDIDMKLMSSAAVLGSVPGGQKSHCS